MIKCQICNQEFKNMITSTHLKQHGISTAEYKTLYGTVVSDEYRKAMSEKNCGKNNGNYGKKHTEEVKKIISDKKKGTAPHNLGKPMSDSEKQNLSEKAKERNANWRETNSHPNVGSHRTEETKVKIKEKRAEQVITTEQVQKAIATKIERGYDLAFFRGRKHSPETLVKLSAASVESNKIKTEQAIEAAGIRLQEYGYQLVSVNGPTVVIKCDQCGIEFPRSRQCTTISKITKDLCPACYPRDAGTSLQETELFNFLSLYTTVVRRSRSIITPQEIDLFLPEFNLAIEYNGLYWHSEEYKDKNYHLNKSIACESKNIRLIHIFEDEWLNNQLIVKSRLLAAIGITSRRIFARQCTVKEIDSSIANKFVNENHLQGAGRANIKLGLFYKDELVSVMTFLKGDISKRIKDWELNRFCSLINTSVIGGASKLFSYFKKIYKPTSIISYSDKRWSKASPVYEQLDFNLVSATPPNYWYYKNGEMSRTHRYSLRKPANSTLSERELRSNEGWVRIYDCGSFKYLWTN
jgi:hypothetical protein